ncbi:guanosine-3',5'-bis(diphosphate) 3'-pyrophosphohydrolase [Escherichia coli]|uniref:Guanosine-3',5'-bis(Diphosphate) 3'-pyrophosphohydrolase n=1 Tax=Escherichia coli TaxID=562 RepID=A0A3S4JS44_ECOLX|nr:guanosine-3',5'-bis(diphosphate) 3'-pyrophosphohydrolase [Escherichia coli]
MKHSKFTARWRHRLGIHHIKTELEELGFEALYPNRYRVIKEVVKAARGNP